MLNVSNIRDLFAQKYEDGEFVLDKSGVKCVEIINASFIANEPAIFGKVTEYADRELAWYKSRSLNVNDIPAPVPEIWNMVSTKDGYINSNYGWCVWSKENGYQYAASVHTLKRDKDSRRACMIYIRPSMQVDYNRDGMSDFMCTYSTQQLIRNNKLDYIVYMRSNDAVFGLRNDKFWHDHIHMEMLKDLKEKYPDLELGTMYWNAASLHVYSRHFFMIDHYSKTGKIHISKAEYGKIYNK